MNNGIEFVSFSSRIGALNTEGTEDTYKAPSTYRVLGGSVTIYDADGAVLPNLAHDEITLSIKFESTDLNLRNAAISAFALKELLENDNFKEKGILIVGGVNTTFKARHTSPSGTVNNVAPIDVKLTLMLEKII